MKMGNVSHSNLFVTPKVINYSLYNKFTGELYLQVTNTQYNRTQMMEGKLRKLILRQKQVAAESWSVDKRLIKLKLQKVY